MDEKKVEKLNKLFEIIKNNTITQKELEQFITVVLSVIKNSKDELKSLSDETISHINNSISYIESRQDTLLSNLDLQINNKSSEVDKSIKLTNSEFSNNIKEVKKLLNEIKKIKSTPGKDGYTPIKGKDYFDGLSAYTPIKGVDYNDGLPGLNGSPDTGEEIINKINDLPTDEDSLKIDAIHIKNLPEITKGIVGGVVARNVYQLGDVSLTSLANNDVLKYNSTTHLWENGAGGGGGTPASPLNSIQYNNAGAFGGSANLLFDGSTLTLTGGINQAGGAIGFNVGVNDFFLRTTAYSDGLIYVNNNGEAYLGDWLGDVNATVVSVNDFIQTITYYANNGHTFTGNVALTTITGVTSGGYITITGATTGATDTGQGIRITGSDGGVTSGGGGSISLVGGDSTDIVGLGGDISFTAGAGVTGEGNNGRFVFNQNIPGGSLGILDFSALNTSTKTFSFPNANGVLVVTDSSNQQLLFNNNDIASGVTGSTYDNILDILTLSNSAINYTATDGHTFTGQVATGAGVSSVAGSANNPLTVTETINGYVAAQIQNLSNGTTASSDIVIANDIDDGTLATGHYIDLGIGSSTNTDPLFPALNGANNLYIYGVGGHLAIGTATTGKHIDFFTGGLEYANRRLRITETGSFAFGALAPNNFVSFAPVRYTTGTASQSGTTVTGVGTVWTSAMIGNLFEFDDGTNSGIITARASNTSITVSVSQTVASQTYSINYLGLEISSTGKVGINTADPQAVLEVTNNLLGASTSNNNGVVVANNTAAALGAQQISPPIRLRGAGWSTTSSASMPVDWVIEHLPVQGAAAPSGFFNLKVSINGGAYSTPFSVSTAGSVAFSGALTATSLSITQTLANSTTLANANFESFSISAGITTAQALNGSTNTQSRTRMGGSGNTVLTANNSHANVFIQGTSITEATSGTHPLLASLAIRPLAITNGTATTTAAATVYIEGAATGTAPTDNFAFWVGSGASKFSGCILATKGANIASANDLTLGADGNTFAITGNTQLNAIITARWTAGSEVILIFTGTPTVKHNTAGGAGTAVLFLAGSVDLVAANNTVLKIVYDGTQWQEVSRKVA